MEGKILDYNAQQQKGLIRGNDENRYEFNASEFRSQEPIRIGQTVHFKIDGENALDIYLLKGNNLISVITNEENISKLSQKAREIISQSIQGDNHNPLGVGASALAIITLFLPLVKQINNSKNHLINDAIGIISLFLLLALGYLFYTGAKRIQTRVLTGIISGLLLSGIYDMFEPMRDIWKQEEAARRYLKTDSGKFVGGLAQAIDPSYTPPNTGFFDVAKFGFFAVILAIIALLFLAFMGSYKEKH
ncbi:hypothetical protein PN471_01375 [Aphanizomenon sp. CS-733/32]|uniref:hypothetical protein n=1 Tax=Aphanizomenon sp. CS-733/32 TaxID=3021715 RepID=UPI002330A099|nr:hypothetical protein [Aphanizomenon sp. CS-733/32]MDB9307329.1 hypothetical protein [Aphanizomenon sp. CS-733/32]